VSKVVVMVSGGLDSAVVVAQALEQGHEVVLLHVDYGQSNAAREMVAVRDIHGWAFWRDHRSARHDVALRDVFAASAITGGHAPPAVTSDRDAVAAAATTVPLRNVVLAVVGAAVAVRVGAAEVHAGVQGADDSLYADSRWESIAATAAAVEAGSGGAVRFVAPIAAWSKARIVRAGADAGLRLALLWSCYGGGPAHCGACGACVKRRRAFVDAGVDDPTPYLPPRTTTQ